MPSLQIRGPGNMWRGFLPLKVAFWGCYECGFQCMVIYGVEWLEKPSTQEPSPGPDVTGTITCGALCGLGR